MLPAASVLRVLGCVSRSRTEIASTLCKADDLPLIAILGIASQHGRSTRLADDSLLIPWNENDEKRVAGR